MRRLSEFARSRSGDKGDTVDISLFAPDDAYYEAIRTHVTPQRVKAHFKDLVKGDVQRYELPKLRTLKFVLHNALDGGASRSLRSDNLGKCFGPLLLGMEIDIP